MAEKRTKKELKEQRKLERQEAELRMEKAEKSDKWKQLGIWGGLVAFLGLTAFLIYTFSKPQPTEPQVSTTVNQNLPAVTADDNVSGGENASVTIIEYGDFQCPACGHYFPMVARLKDEYKDRIRFVYRHFPLNAIHANAQLAAQASYAAGQQGKFWEMHDTLFRQQANWGESTDARSFINQYAGQLNLNMDQFTADLDSEEAKTFVDNQAEGGAQAGVSGTPTFFMNSKRITNPSTYEDLKALVESELGSQ